MACCAAKSRSASHSALRFSDLEGYSIPQISIGSPAITQWRTEEYGGGAGRKGLAHGFDGRHAALHGSCATRRVLSWYLGGLSLCHHRCDVDHSAGHGCHGQENGPKLGGGPFREKGSQYEDITGGSR